MARREPLVLALEDIHWADSGMLDLIEYLAQWVRAPLLIVCLARDELLERRTGWGGGRRDYSSIFLEPLTTDETRELVAALLPVGQRHADALQVVAERAGGNPLFAEEMVHRLGRGRALGDAAQLPDTVQALLAARLDSLEPFERRLDAAGGGHRADLLAGRARAGRSRGGPRPRRPRSCRSSRRTWSCPGAARSSPASPSSRSSTS